MKDSNEVIQEFNELINMTATELEKWLKSDDSRSAGWPKEGGEGESIGHDSGRQIVEILKSNPNKDPEKYTDEQVQHMRKVVSYCKRHLAQEEKIDNEKSVEELKKTKSYASLKNWGHDILKKRGKTDDDAAEDDEGEEKEEQEEDEKKAGDKRKAASGQAGSKKKRETQKGESNGADEEEAEDEGDEELEEVEEDGDEDDEGQDTKANGKSSGSQRTTRSKDAKNGDNQEDEAADEEDDEEADGDDGGSKKTTKGPKKGETVSWNWGQGQPEGKVLDVKPETTTIETKRGNEVSRKGTEDDPAVVLDAGKSKAIKLNHELN